jgi:hypothetical protein
MEQEEERVAIHVPSTVEQEPSSPNIKPGRKVGHQVGAQGSVNNFLPSPSLLCGAQRPARIGSHMGPFSRDHS